MADEEAESVGCPGGRAAADPPGLGQRLQELEEVLRRSGEPAEQAASDYCQRFCQTLLEYAEKWKASDDHLPLLEAYTDAIQSYSKARKYLTSDCENVPVVLERLSLSCAEILLGLPHDLPDNHWKGFQTSIQGAYRRLLDNGILELHFLYTLSQERGVWQNPVLHSILNEESVGQDKVNQFLTYESPILLEMRIKHLLKTNQIAQATTLAKLCSEHQDLKAKSIFKQMYLVCLCSQSPNIQFIEEIAKIDCKDALEMICNLESEGDEKTALIICAAFLSRQLQHGEMDCAWELTLFWSKLQQRVDPSVQVYLERCRQLSLLTKTVYHIFFLIKIIQSETEGAGLATCIELCVKALRLESGENANVKISICKTISCLLPDDLEVKRACQLSEFLLEPTVDAYYAVEMLYNQPDQKYDEDSLPVPNSLRCELLLVLKTRWPFDPEFWDWKTLKRQCLALMGEEASIVSSIDELNDSEVYEKLEDSFEDSKESSVHEISNSYFSADTMRDAQDDKLKKRDIKKLREKGFVSARFRNFQAYMQYCVLCDKEFLGHRIIRHAQKHLTDGIYSCPICAKKFDSKERLVPHVTLHVKQSSKERLAAMKPLRRLGRPSKRAIKNEKQKSISKQEQRSVKKNSFYSDDFVVFEDDDGSDEENSINYESEKPDASPFLKLSNDPEFNCPVLACKKGFKYYKNLIAHVKAHKGSEEAMRYLEMQSKKVICHYCRRHFVSVAHLNDHLQMHCGSKPYMCIQMKCGASFDSNAQLLAHRKEHQEFKAKCMFPKCGRIFFESSTLYVHEAQHYHTYTCKSKGCGKVFHSQIQLERHLDSHEVKKEDEIKSQSNGTVKHIQPLVENKDIKNAPVKSEPTYNSNCISNINNASRPLDVKRVKDEPLDTVQTLTKCLDHTAIGVCTSRVLPPSKELSQVLFPTTVLNKASPKAVISGQLLSQSSLDALEKSDASSSSSHIKSPINQGICDIILTKEKFAAAVNMIDTGNTILSQIYTAVKDACSDSKNLPVFHDSKEPGCYNQTKQDLNVPVHSGSSKIDLATQSVESKMGTVVHLGFDNQALYESSFVFPEFEDHVNTAANLLTLPSNTSNGSLFVSTQSSLGNPLVTSSVLKQLPVQKFTCKIEGCSKIYNSIQSIGKHMKAEHKAQYPEFTLERKRRKRQRSRNSGNGVHNAKLMFDRSPQVNCSNNTVLQQLKTSDTNNTYSTDFQSLQTPVCAARLENLVNPILPCIENLNRGAKCQKNGTATFLGAQFEDLSKPALPLKFESESDPFLPLPAEDCSLSTFSSLALHGTNAVFCSLGNNSHEIMSQTEAAACSGFPKEEYSGYTDREFNFTGSSSTSDTKKECHDQSPSRKQRRHASRAKCPAIIRDGKFICRMCFRVFNSASSLGGHLSKGARCKPSDGETELSEEHLDSSKQASLLANMILSSNLQSHQSHFSPETCFKDASFRQSLSVESQSSSFLQNLITQASSANFNSCLHGERHEIMKQPLETAGIVGTLGCSEMLPAPSNCIVGNSTLNSMVLPCTNRSAVLDPVCNAGMMMMMMMVDKSKTLNSECDERMQPAFSTDLLNNFNNAVCSHPTLAPPFVASKSCRVSVISGPLSTTSSEIDSKKEGGSKMTNTVAPFHEADLAKNSIASDLLTPMGNLAKNVQEKVGKPTSILHKNVISSCEPHLMENITNKCNTNENNHACVGSIDDHLKQNTVLPSLVQQSIKTEIEDSKYLNSQKTEVFMDGLKATTNIHVTVGKWEVRNQVPCDLSTAAPPDTIENSLTNLNDSPKMLATNSTQLLGSATDYSIVNLTSEMAVADDQNVLEILELLKRLKLENDLVTNGFDSDTASASPPSDVCSPISPLSIPACRISVQKVPDSDQSNQLLEEKAKPFVCCEKACIYRAMTKDALFKHYRRVHKYTDDKLKDIKRNQSKFAPFRCVIPSCTKTFTRNSNLRTHCQAVHHFSADEMEKLRLKRPFEGSLNEGMITTPARVGAKRMHAEVEVERKIEPLVSIHSGGKPEVDLNQHKHIPDEQACRLGLAIKKEENLQREERTHKKIHENDGILLAKSSPYRPYSCVHQNCCAAFTIQQNLILHYQALHKSELPKFELEEDSETYTQHDETESSRLGEEFRCQEYDCSRIFQEASSLIQHYMKLHEMMPEEIEQVMPASKFGRFKCDQPQCISSFTSCSNYLNHLEEDHEIKIKQCREDGIYKCDCEGCDRIYATRSNLLRHIFSKHNDKHLEHLLRRKRFFQDYEENYSNKANEYKPIKCKPRELKYDNSEKEQMRKKTLHPERNMSNIKVNTPVSPLKYGKKFLFLKTKFDALAECSDNVRKQYPCMIKGCTSIVTGEHNIIRHYTCHKITRAFTLSHRSSLILCKRKPIPQVKAVSSDDEVVRDKRTGINQFDESSESSDESVESTSQLSETERDEVDELIELLDMKLIEDNGPEDQAKTSTSKNHDREEAICSHPQKNNLKRVFKEKVCQNKKRKIENSDAEEIPVKNSNVHSGEETTVAGETPEDTTAIFDLSSFKPMGFELSFLKFLEESAVKDTGWDIQTSPRKAVEETTSEEDTSDETTSKGTAGEDTAGEDSAGEDTASSDETAVGKITGIASGGGTAVSEGVSNDERNVRHTPGGKNFTNEVYREKTYLVKGYTCLKAVCENFIRFANPSKLQCIGNIQFDLDETLKGCTKQALKQLQEMKPTVILKNLDDLHCADTVTSEQSFGEFGEICSTAN